MYYVNQQKDRKKQQMLDKLFHYLKNHIISAKIFIELGVILLGCVIISYSAKYLWAADLFSHFVFQYVLGAVVFTLIFIALRSWRALLLPLCILLLCLPKFAYIKHSQPITNVSNQPTYKILHFNKLVTNKSIDSIEKWIRSIEPQPHTIVLHEASLHDVKLAEALSDLFPHQINEVRNHAFGAIILNHTPFKEVEKIDIPDVPLENFALKATFSVEGIDNDITLYALHAIPPMTHARWSQRNIELSLLSDTISRDNSPNILFAGDWNITPYSPFFYDTLHTSKLNIVREPIFAKATWPNFGKIAGFPLLQIPIDHILFSNNLSPTFKRVEKSLGSDHHPTLMSFTEN